MRYTLAMTFWVRNTPKLLESRKIGEPGAEKLANRGLVRPLNQLGNDETVLLSQHRPRPEWMPMNCPAVATRTLRSLCSDVRILTAIVISVCLSAGGRCEAGPKVFLGIKNVPEPISMDQVDHSAWTQLLQKHVDPAGNVNYRAWHASPPDQQQLDQYLLALSAASSSIAASKESQLAFWINAYNAVTIKGMLREYPTTSIRNHTAKLFGYNIWNDLQLYVGGNPISLNDIEHKVLRKMNEPRIHFAIVCASKSCPRLMNEAYLGTKLEQQLNLNAKHFFSQPENFRFDGNTVTLSAILDWFGEDFGPNNAAVIRRILPLLPDNAAQSIAPDRVNIRYAEYDWSLNGI